MYKSNFGTLYHKLDTFMFLIYQRWKLFFKKIPHIHIKTRLSPNCKYFPVVPPVGIIVIRKTELY